MTWQERAIQLWREKIHSWGDIIETLTNEYPGETFCKDKVRAPIRALPDYKARKESDLNVVLPHRKTVLIKGDGSRESDTVIKADDEQLNDVEYLLKAHGFKHPEEWELLFVKNSIYNVQIKGGSTDTYYASKLTVKPSTKITEKDTLEHFIEQAAKYSPATQRTVTNTGDHIFVINVSDLHIGQLSWGAESGENYDFKIASDRFRRIISDAINKSPFKEYAKIYFIKGNDFFNIDNMEGSTTAGTKQTQDVRPQKMFDKGTDLWIWAIDALRMAFPTAPIETVLVPGNHDTLTSFYASKVLYAWFKNDDTVKVDTMPRKHKGFAYGDTALLFTHGQHELKNLDWVYTEFRDLVGKTKATEIHAGHQHKIKVEEKNGAIIRVNPAPPTLDNWSYSEGYNSIAQSISRVYSTKGLEYELYSRSE